MRTDFSNKPNHRWPPEDGPSGMNGASIINSEAESMRVRRWLTKYGRSATQFKKTDFGDCVGEIEKGSFHWLVVPSLSVVASFEQLRRLVISLQESDTELWTADTDRCLSYAMIGDLLRLDLAMTAAGHPAFFPQVGETGSSPVADVVRSLFESFLCPPKPILTTKPARGDRGHPYPISALRSTIVCGNCHEVLPTLPDESVDLVFTSPPYFNARPDCHAYVSYADYLEEIRLVVRELLRVLVEGRFFVLNTSPIIVPRGKRSESSTRLAVPFDLHSVILDEGFEFIDDIIWKKPEAAGGRRGQRFALDRTPLAYKPLPVTEYVVVYRKPSDRLIDWSIRHHPDQKLVHESRIMNEYERTNIWEIAPAQNGVHPAVFPLELAEKVIRYYSFREDVVLDPFAGSCTTGRAARLLGRRYYLIEQHRRFLDPVITELGDAERIGF